VGEAVAQEDSLMSFSILEMVDAEMTPIDFVRRAASAFFLWPNALLDEHINHALLANLVQHTCSAVTRAAGTGMCLSVGRRCRGSVSAWAQSLSRPWNPAMSRSQRLISHRENRPSAYGQSNRAA
jgi:hypothetical protein